MKYELVLGRVCCEFNCVVGIFERMLESLIWVCDLGRLWFSR